MPFKKKKPHPWSISCTPFPSCLVIVSFKKWWFFDNVNEIIFFGFAKICTIDAIYIFLLINFYIGCISELTPKHQLTLFTGICDSNQRSCQQCSITCGRRTLHWDYIFSKKYTVTKRASWASRTKSCQQKGEQTSKDWIKTKNRGWRWRWTVFWNIWRHWHSRFYHLKGKRQVKWCIILWTLCSISLPNPHSSFSSCLTVNVYWFPMLYDRKNGRGRKFENMVERNFHWMAH